MYSSRLVSVLVVVVSILCLVQANWWDVQKIHHRGLIRRADLSDVVGDLKDTTSADDPTPSATPPSQTTSSTPAQTTSEDSHSSTSASPPSSPSATSETPSATPAPGSSSSPAPTTADPTTAAPDTTTSPGSPTPSATTPPSTTTSSSGDNSGDDGDDGGDGTSDPKTTDGGDTKGGSSPSAAPSAVVSTKVEIVIKTNTDGSKTTQTTTTKTTSTAALNADSQKPTGMSTKTRNTIIGVVVGVGGAAILGALILVAFRVWGRKRHAEEADGLMAYNSDLVAGAEKTPRGSSSAGQRNPFQSTLENYHQPVNASANF
ncbi:hypothetical protein J3F83DRAFT_755587 [Trichoderma novae-zelandiae]